MSLIKNHISILLPLAIITASSRVFPAVSFLYYLTPVLLVLFIAAGYSDIKESKSLKIYLLMLLAFGVWAMLTSLWSDYSFVSLSRALYFLLVAFGASFGVVIWLKKHNSGKNIFGFLLPANILIVVSSLISLVVGFPENAWTGGNGMGFMGFVAHQNTLGALILFTFPAPFYLLVKSISKENCHSEEQSDVRISKVMNILSYLLLVSNILLLFLSHSRASLLALAVGIVLTFFLYFNKRQKIYFIGSLTLIVVIVAFTPSLSSKMGKYLYKGTPTITANRDILWEPSYEAAKLGGIFGIGYGISHPSIISEGVGSHYEKGRYVREKGNSILALVEEVGIVGFVLFVLPILYVFKNIFSSSFKRIGSNSLKSDILCLESIIFLSFIIAFLLHSQFEAWFVGVGGFSLLIFLMFLGNTVISDE